jgi:tetratricopeptide (TPR) repeat protein
MSHPKVLFITVCFIQLFGWDLKSLWQKAHQKRCEARLLAGRLEETLQLFRHMMDTTDDSTRAGGLDWSNGKSSFLMSRTLEFSPAFHTAFKEECNALCLVNGDIALAASDYDKAIDLYSAAIDLNPASYVVFAKRSKTKSEKMLWDDALLDAQKVR